MMSTNQTRNWISNKTMRIMMFAVLLCVLIPLSSHATNNVVTGTAYGPDNSMWTNELSITSTTNGTGTLAVGFAGTTNITLNDHNIEGYIVITNNFSSFTIDGGSSIVSNKTRETSVLTITGGTNLTILGGSYVGVAGSDENAALFTYSVDAAHGGLISGVQNGTVSNATLFKGSRYSPNLYSVIGTHALQIENTTDLVISGSSSRFEGGIAGIIERTNEVSVISSGGSGLTLSDSHVTVNSGTFTGGGAGRAVANEIFGTSQSLGGHGISVTNNSTIRILLGTFTGSNAGTADISRSGSGLYALNSSVDIEGGTFTGGDRVNFDTATGGHGLHATNSTVEIDGSSTFTGGRGAEAVLIQNSPAVTISGSPVFTAATNAVAFRVQDSSNVIISDTPGFTNSSASGFAAFYAENSDLTINGGSFFGGVFSGTNYYGLYSRVDSNQTHTIELNGGTFDRLGFGGEGTQLLTAGTNLTSKIGVVLNEGTLIVTNMEASPSIFQTNIIQSGTMQFTEDFTLADKGRLRFTSHEGLVEFADVTFESGSELFYTITSSNTSGIQGDNIYFEAGASIRFTNAVAGLAVGESITSKVATATSGIFLGASAIPATNHTVFTEYVNIPALAATRTGFKNFLFDGNTNLEVSALFSTDTLRDYWNATGQFGELADELDALSNTVLWAAIDTIANPSISGPLAEQTYFTTFNTFQTSLRGFQMALGQSSSRGTLFRQQLRLLPSGARGPTQNNDMRGWAKYYGQLFEHDQQGLNPEYETTLNGGAVGIDKSFGNLILGLSGGSGNYVTEYDTDGEETITAYHGSAYGTYGTDYAYVDFGVGYSQNEVESKTAIPFVLEGEYEGRVMGGHLGAGYDIIDHKEGMIFTPEISVHYAVYEQDAYTETGEIFIPRQINAFEAESLRSSVGLNLATLDLVQLDSFSLKYDIRAHWLREFNTDPDDMTFQLVGGDGSTYMISHPSLEEDVYQIGVGVSFFNSMRNKPKNVMLRVDFDEIFSENFNSHNLSASVTYAF